MSASRAQRVALTGADGQLAEALRDRMPGEIAPLSRTDLDVADPLRVAAVLDEIRPTVVVNTAAYNIVDRAESEPEPAYRVNALGPRNLAAWCARHDALLVHVSTDYVFSGRDASGTEGVRAIPYAESDTPSPLGAYAATKLAGEIFVLASCRRHFVVRTCGLYGRPKTGPGANFVETMLRIGREGRRIQVVNDQRCTPTSTVDLAQALVDLSRTSAYGLYHATSSGSTTWYEFAREIFRIGGLAVDLHPITSEQYAAAARRPSYSVLDGRKLAAAIGHEQPHWRDALERYLAARTATP